MTPLRSFVLSCGLIGSLAAPAAAHAQSSEPPVRIAVAGDTPEARQARDQLLRILSTWDLARWRFTPDVRIEARVIPHSHPVLTLNTAYLANDTAQIATYVHEQLHWYFVERKAATDSTIAELERRFPDAPSGPPEGARDRHSTYLHLLVCLLEFDALRTVFDDGVARRTIAAWRHYPWVYRQVLERPEPIREVLTRHGLASPDARTGSRPH